jgi:hypothetical protein
MGKWPATQSGRGNIPSAFLDSSRDAEYLCYGRWPVRPHVVIWLCEAVLRAEFSTILARDMARPCSEGKPSGSERPVAKVAALGVPVLEPRKPMRGISSLENSGVKIGGIALRLVLLLAVCSLIANVATRYSSSIYPQGYPRTCVQKDSSAGSHHQRLTKGASSWVLVLVRWTRLQVPTYACRMASTPPDFPAAISYENLFSRPPPVA